MKISNKGSTYRGSWDVLELEIYGTNVPTITKSMLSMDENSRYSDGHCDPDQMFDKIISVERAWYKYTFTETSKINYFCT